MTKRQKGECSTFGCHKKAQIDLVLLGINTTYFCDTHWMRYLGHITAFLYKRKEFRQIIADGVDIANDRILIEFTNEYSTSDTQLS